MEQLAKSFMRYTVLSFWSQINARDTLKVNPEDMHTVAITPGTKSPPKPGEKGKPTPESQRDHRGDPYQAQLYRFDEQGAYFDLEIGRASCRERV